MCHLISVFVVLFVALPHNGSTWVLTLRLVLDYNELQHQLYIDSAIHTLPIIALKQSNNTVLWAILVISIAFITACLFLSAQMLLLNNFSKFIIVLYHLCIGIQCYFLTHYSVFISFHTLYVITTALNYTMRQSVNPYQ